MFDVAERAAANVKALKEVQQKAKRAKNMVSDDGITSLIDQVVQAKGRLPCRHRSHGGARRRSDAQPVGCRAGAHDGSGRDGGCRREGRQARAHGGGHRRGRWLQASTPGALIKAMGPAIKGGGGGGSRLWPRRAARMLRASMQLSISRAVSCCSSFNAGMRIAMSL